MHRKLVGIVRCRHDGPLRDHLSVRSPLRLFNSATEVPRSTTRAGAQSTRTHAVTSPAAEQSPTTCRWRSPRRRWLNVRRACRRSTIPPVAVHENACVASGVSAIADDLTANSRPSRYGVRADTATEGAEIDHPAGRRPRERMARGRAVDGTRWSRRPGRVVHRGRNASPHPKRRRDRSSRPPTSTKTRGSTPSAVSLCRRPGRWRSWPRQLTAAAAERPEIDRAYLRPGMSRERDDEPTDEYEKPEAPRRVATTWIGTDVRRHVLPSI